MNAIYTSEAGASEIIAHYDAALRDWPVPAEHLRVPTRAGETFVVASGADDAPPLVLLHGSGARTTAWRGDVASWSRHFRTYAVDLIGEPGHSAPTRPPLDSAAYADWLDDVLDALGVTAAAFAGMSLGGWVAADYATRRTARVSRLVLLCPGGFGRQKYGWLAWSVLTKPFGRRGLRRSVSAMTGLSAAETGPLLDDIARTFAAFKPRTQRLPVFGAEALRRLDMPVLVVVGDRDAMFDSAGTARRVRAYVPNATVRELPGTGHAILGETERVLTFLRA